MNTKKIIAKKLHIKNFRKLKNSIIPIGQNLTVIAGHNGVGKSNILSLIASGSGTKKFKTRHGHSFHPEFYEFFHIDQSELDEKYRCFLEYSHIKKDSTSTISTYSFCKELSLKDDTAFDRPIRIVPRTSNYLDSTKTIKDTQIDVRDSIGIGPAARVPLPTLYLSLSRLYPLGESKAKTTSVSNSSSIIVKQGHNEYRDWYNKVLKNSINSTSENLSIIQKKVTKRESYYMDISNTTPLTQSIGQDNLGNIISALVEFFIISTSEDYPGGILCIDEIDVSLHPNAQINLIDLLVKLSEELNLQIIVSTHSLTIIKEILRLQQKDKDSYRLVYLKDSLEPYVSEMDNYNILKADLFQEKNPVLPKVKIYFEDSCTRKIYDLLIKAAQNLGILNNSQDFYAHETIDVQLGCDNLLQLSKKDPYFKNVCIILDGDARSGQKLKVSENLTFTQALKSATTRRVEKNIVFLPNYFAPESYLYRIIHEYYSGDYPDFWRSLDRDIETSIYTKTHIMEHLLINKETFNNDDLKKKSDYIFTFVEKSDIIQAYYSNENHKKELEKFIGNLKDSLNILRKKLYARSY